MITLSEHVAAVLAAQGKPPTEAAIRAALAPGRRLDLERELAEGYEAACRRWGKDPARSAARTEGGQEGATVRL